MPVEPLAGRQTSQPKNRNSLPKETENAEACKERGFSMTPAARLWNVRRAWMAPWLNESQKSDRIRPGSLRARDFEREREDEHERERAIRFATAFSSPETGGIIR